MAETLPSDEKDRKITLPSDRAFGLKDLVWILRKIRKLLVGRLAPAKVGASHAGGGRRREYRATKLAFRNDLLTGVVTEGKGGPAPDALYLHCGATVVEPLARDTQAIRGDVDGRSGRFVIDLRGRSVPSLLERGATIRTGDGRVIGRIAELGHRLVQLKWAELRGNDLRGSLLLEVTLTEPIDLDIETDGVLAATIAVPIGPAGSARDFVVPIAGSRTPEATVVARIRGTAKPVPGSPRRARQSGDRVLVSNCDFSRWSGAMPEGWTVRLSTGATIEPAAGAPVLLQGLDFGRGGCLLRDELGIGSLGGTRLSQRIPLPGASVDVVLVARASSPVSVDLGLSSGTSSREETVAIGPVMAVHHLRLVAPAAEGEADLHLSLPDAAPDLQIAFLAAGPPGLGLTDAVVGRAPGAEHRGAGNAVVNGRFIAWSGSFRRQLATRVVQLAPGWRLASRGEPGKLDLRLAEIVTRDLRTGDSGDILYGPALIGSSGKGIRIEARLDRMEVLSLERAHLSFYARRASPSTPGAAIAGSPTSSIREIVLLERRMETLDAEAKAVDKRLATVKRDVAVGQSGEYFFFPIRSDEWQRVRQACRASSADPATEYLLGFDFGDAVDIAFTDVALGEAPAAEDDRAAGPDGFRNLECAFVRAQLPLLRGIEHWGRPQRVVVPDAQVAAERTQAAVRWAWPADPSLSADIVVCVHEAMDETIDCLRSIERNTGVPHTLTIVDDLSSEATREQLRQYAAVRPWVRLIENRSNLGYTRSANIGLSSSDAPWVVLLNSDTIVTPGWLTSLFEPVAGRSDVAMVGPLSNAASWQSVPEVHNPKGGWMVNRLPDGMTADDVAALVSSLSQRAFPSVALLNGFCTLMRRSVLEEVGFLDEESFPVGYGEENDLCLRVHKRGYKLLVADHVYVYHVKSASFGPEKRTELVKLGHKRLLAKHPDVDLSAAERELAEAVPLITLRRRMLDHLAAR